MTVKSPQIRQQPEISLDTQATVLQRLASDPNASAWVGASAGSGKTKVLTDRILRLLLPNENDTNATPPHKILALTFTKAGASEMAHRIHQRLSEWAIMPETDGNDSSKGLAGNLKVLLGTPATQLQMSAARKLFATVIDAPGGLKIMTIHSFCQSVLGRFPIEAKLTPGFKPLEEAEANRLKQLARYKVFRDAEREKGSPLANAVHHLARLQNKDQLEGLINNVLSERRQFNRIIQTSFGIDGLYTKICKNLNVPDNYSADEIIHAACDSKNFDEPGLRAACAVLANGSDPEAERGIEIQAWLDADILQRQQTIENYFSVFLNNEGNTKKIFNKNIKDNHQQAAETLKKEANRLYIHQQTILSLNLATATRDLFLIGKEIQEEYQNLKNQNAALDFDDLILKTLDLLKGENGLLNGLNPTPWIRYKMDQGIDHILVDEAQDTNPEQWEIIKALCDDFFDGESKENRHRSLFVVGDEKQSIFSFQRAAPKKFREMQHWFKSKITAANKELREIPFTTSFRSVPSVLELVDTVFADDTARKGLGDAPITHIAHRSKQPGLVQLWPLFKSDPKREFSWTDSSDDKQGFASGSTKMAEHIGNTIENWIKNKEPLESHDRAIEPGDIMILVRTRTAFIEQLVRALKTRNIEVSGVDRMVLNDQLVVQDLIAAAQFALLPSDDLNLAGLLKSPFIGWSEEQLYAAAHGRQESLWQQVKQSNDKNTTEWLENLITKAGQLSPYDFFMMVLMTPCPADSGSGLRALHKRLGMEISDALNEFTNFTLNYSKNNIATLQNFLHIHNQRTDQIKREMEEGGKAVRIMTVHAAKGLQAPIVILPDTVIASSLRNDRIFWPHKGAEIPVFYANKESLPHSLLPLYEEISEQQREEYRRLLYVALTRAENRLYIGGYHGKHTPKNSWYNYIKTAFEKLPNVEKTPFQDDEILTYRNKLSDKPDKIKNVTKTSIENEKIPEWVYQHAKAVKITKKPLSPSHLTEQEELVISPLKLAENQRFKRGNITHKLLQILPDMPPEQRSEACKIFLSQPALALDNDMQLSIREETLGILSNRKFFEIFGVHSMAEVPISGLNDEGISISGQIDRLLIKEKEILIIDYKTNRPPPDKAEDVPEVYMQQMRAYRDILRKIYPEKTIKTALIWTDGCRLMELNLS